jgi:hypothetical protein
VLLLLFQNNENNDATVINDTSRANEREKVGEWGGEIYVQLKRYDMQEYEMKLTPSQL